jgi:DNA (cytosine-5)-methyltransferase 1
MKKIPIIDLFAGPGGLGEGFSSVYNKEDRVFDIKISIEKDENAHKTLELRSFYRQFPKGNAPEKYYNVLKESNPKKRDLLKSELFEEYKKEYKIARDEAWRAELGSEKFPSELVDSKIKKALGKANDWVLIGGPPCQAYSMAGRSRVGGISNLDHRVYLYKEYLRIIAEHHPTVFVMENVKGLLSAKVDGMQMFDLIKKDLTNPSSVFKESESPKYKVYSLSTIPEAFDQNGHPIYKDNKGFLIQAEKFNVPQKRHRVILLGIREDIKITPSILTMGEREVKLKDVIGDLPKLRSGLGRSIVSSKIVSGKKKRVYKKEIDTNENWQNRINSFYKLIHTWNGFKEKGIVQEVSTTYLGKGSEYIEFNTPHHTNPLRDWYKDDNLKGVCNHETRTHLVDDLKRYLFASIYAEKHDRFPRLRDYDKHSKELMPDHESARSGKFADRFRVQMPNSAATTVTSHISKDGHYFIHYDPKQCRSLTVREAARIQTFPDNYLFCGPRTAQYHQVGNAVPPYLANQIAHIVNDLFKNK